MIKKGIFSERLDLLIGEKFGNYSKYIIQERALPDLRDGLKPVQRRILYAMSALKITHDSPYKKSARVVGDVIGKYHPHGDSSVYEAMVRLGQEWKLNIPLVDMHGNKGSIDGDSPAAMRYTETRLSKISQHLLVGLEKNIVNFSPNFDDAELEPVVFPARYPNLLVNGSTGIASGYSTNIPPHNINEVIRAVKFVLKTEAPVLSDITKIVKGPDFPTGGEIDVSEIKEVYKTGKGKVTIRAKMSYDEKSNTLIVTEVPFEVNKSEMVRKIDEMIRSGKISGIKEVRDDTDRTGLQVSIMLATGANVEAITKYLFKNTDLQKRFNINMVVIKDKRPEQLSLLDIVQTFANFQIEIYTNLFKFELNKYAQRLEIVDGLIKVVDIIDKIIAIIRKSENKKEAKERIMKSFDFTDRQAEAIVNLRLYRLTSTDINQLLTEQKELNKLIKHFTKGLKDKAYLNEEIVKELDLILEEFKQSRRSKIVGNLSDTEVNETDLITEEKIAVTVSQQGYIKKVSLKSKELSGSETGKRVDDIILSSFESSNMKNIILFSSTGKYYSLPIYKLKDFKWKDVGQHLSTITGMDGLDKIVAVAVASSFENMAGNLVISTKKGMIKQTNISGLTTSLTKRGGKYMGIKGEDEVVSISVAYNQKYFVTTVTEGAISLKYSLDAIPIVGLSASGVKNINLNPEDTVAATIIQDIDKVDDGKAQVILFTNIGKAKRVKTKEVKGVSRGSRGSFIVKQVKSNPFRVINVFDPETSGNLKVLDTSDQYLHFKPKENIPISDYGTGTSAAVTGGIKLIFDNVLLNFDKSKQKLAKTKTKKGVQLELDNILDSF